MPEIGTSGSMSGDGKRGVAEWPKLPRPSSTLPITTKLATHHDGRKGPIGQKVHRSEKSAYSITSSARRGRYCIAERFLAVFR